MSDVGAKQERSATPAVAFYCVADERYFLGAVGLVNSLRLVGHDEPIYLLDCGLSASQRELLATQVTLVDGPGDAEPTLLKAIAPLRHPAAAMVLLDTDLVVTRPLDYAIAAASAGSVVAFAMRQRRVIPEWGPLLDLGEVRDQTYLDFALLGVPEELGAALLGGLSDLQPRIEFERTMWGRDEAGYALRYADQDVLNAILASRVEPDRIVALDDRLAPVPPFDGLRVADEQTLRCVTDEGIEPLVVHHFIVKPWLEPTHHGVYSQLLRRLLVGPDLAIRVSPDQVPLRFRSGPLAYLERKRINVRERFRWHVREPLAERRAGKTAGGVE